VLGGRVVFSEERHGQRVAVIEMEQPQVFNARNFGAARPF
jgi:hypothetical protein